MLTYAFDLLYAIYEEEGYEPSEIPEKILSHNLYGVEIDQRAGNLAAFALTMKAVSYFKRAKRKRFFRDPVQSNICVLENISLGIDTINNYKNTFGETLFSPDVMETLQQFKEADNFGSLIIPKSQDLSEIISELKNLQKRSSSKIGSDDRLPQNQEVLVRAKNFRMILAALQQADYLSQKYHVVIANPPYMGGKGMNGRLAKWAKANYPNSKPDLFAMFIERNLDLAQQQGVVAMITMQSWMFLSSYEKLRIRLLEQGTILSMAHLGTRAFDSIGGEVVSTTAFVIENAHHLEYKGAYVRLVEGMSEQEKAEMFKRAIE